MDLNDIRTLWTIVSFVAFIGIVGWAFGRKRKQEFEEAARLAVDDEPVAPNDSNGPRRVA